MFLQNLREEDKNLPNGKIQDNTHNGYHLAEKPKSTLQLIYRKNSIQYLGGN